MMKFIETPRLFMREIVVADAPAMFELDSDPEVNRYLGNRPVTSLEQVYGIIDFIRAQYAENGIGRWAVILKETNEFIGWSGLKLDKDKNGYGQFYDLGYRFIPKFWGKGFATESAKAFVAYGFNEMNIDKICGHTMIGNVNSGKVLQKAGLRFTNTFEEDGETCNWYEMDRKTGAKT
ncbi:GNAT family N-acetyltransferase [Flavobacterium pallidum]|uniref:GNAT family N-acetyltransferase n=1 Tax=Flavobacterium pallidum TaxID=2172098 RepID=A0A2S1SHY8_9FLAO|nr:GNAT family N-acetyltransferase [Flavobacterium pallidum]AWI26023.1 GNAT family N-acetyltransferase [Flavobacterium pallidum]